MSQTVTATDSAPPAMGLSTFSTIDELLKAQAARPDDPVLVAYPVTDIDDFEEHTAKSLDRYTEAAAAKYKSLGLKPVDPTSPSTPVVALLAPSSFEVIITILAVSRLGWALLFLSPRLVPAAHARLLQMCDCTTMIVAPVYQPTIPAISSSLSSTNPSQPPLKSIPLITRPDYRSPPSPVSLLPTPPPSLTSLQSTKTAWIIHSSGSTGFPKPIPLSHRALLANFSKGLGLRAFCASPLFHSHGLMELFRCFYRGAPMYMANHARPVTRANLVRAMRVARPGLVTAVPFVLGLLSEEGGDGVAELAKAEVVMFAGSACPDEVGERLVRAGVRLVANYGSSETGAIMSSLRPAGDTAWSYLRMPAHIAPHVLMDEISPGIFECVALESLPSRGPTNCSDPPNSYRTRDLFTRHPTNHSWWKYLTRLDDRLTLVNGEKVLPLPIEGRVRQCPLVAEAVVFGAGRSVPGMLVFRDEEGGGGAGKMGEGEFVEAIWGDVEEANRGAESFSRIPRELVVVMPPGTSWPRTDKGTAVRQQVYEVFKDVIDEAYARFEHGDEGEGDGEPLLSLDVPELEQWLLERFQVDLGVGLDSVDADVFAAGVDSLQTTRIWSLIRKKLDLGGKQEALSQNVVYEKGTLRALAKHLYGLRTGEDVGQSDEEELLAMQELVDEFSTFHPHVPGTAPAPVGEVVLLTGATGGLGAHLLTTLLSRPDVQHIYALARASDASTAQSRILASLASRGIPSPSTLEKLTAVPSSDLSLPGLGLPADVLERLKHSLTCVIHAAWPVNFTLPVRAFRPHIAGLHALLQLCLDVRTARGPAALYFASSVSAVGGMAGLPNATATTTTTPSSGDGDQAPAVVTVPEAVPQPLAAAQKMGYGRSKLVAEKMVEAAAVGSAGLRARVLRIGQLVGDLYGVGDWNTTEAIPLLVRGVWSTGVLPALDESPSWLPIDVAAAAILDIALPDERKSGGVEGGDGDGVVYHILNPQHFHWTRDFVPALQKTGLLPEFEVVSPEEWLAKLRESDPDVEKNPSRKLLEFWEGKYEQRPAGKKVLRHETKNTLEKAPRLGDVPLADVLKNGDWLERVVRRWISTW